MSPEVELPTLFGPPPRGGTPLVAKELDDLQPGRKVRLVSYTRTFVIWRPWNKCDRCMKLIGTGELELPDVGDYTCPHVQVADYKEVKDKTLSGDALKEFEEHFQLHDGTRCVEFSWLETDPEFLEEMKRKAEAQDPVYPPNPEKAFAKKEEEESGDQKETPATEEADASRRGDGQG